MKDKSESDICSSGFEACMRFLQVLLQANAKVKSFLRLIGIFVCEKATSYAMYRMTLKDLHRNGCFLKRNFENNRKQIW